MEDFKKNVQKRCDLRNGNMLSALVRFYSDQYLLWLHPGQVYCVCESVPHRNLSGSGVNRVVTLHPPRSCTSEHHNKMKSNNKDVSTSNLVYLE